MGVVSVCAQPCGPTTHSPDCKVGLRIEQRVRGAPLGYPS
jgi:hypothetical protein